MGYSTDFKGKLNFNYDLTGTELAQLNQFLGEDCREHKDWIDTDGLTHVDLELTEDFEGIRWDGSEKTYDLTEKVNMIVKNMGLVNPDFGFNGKLFAQGDEPDDRWELIINDEGYAEKRDIAVVGDKVTCPHCEEDFIYEGK